MNKTKKRRRWVVAMDLQSSGLKHKEIADKMGISRNYVSVLLAEARLRMSDQYKPQWNSEISVRLANILSSMEIRTRDEARDAWLAGRFSNGTKRSWRLGVKAYSQGAIRNYGKQTRDELAAWIGVDK